MNFLVNILFYIKESLHILFMSLLLKVYFPQFLIRICVFLDQFDFFKYSIFTRAISPYFVLILLIFGTFSCMFSEIRFSSNIVNTGCADVLKNGPRFGARLGRLYPKIGPHPEDLIGVNWPRNVFKRY